MSQNETVLLKSASVLCVVNFHS